MSASVGGPAGQTPCSQAGEARNLAMSRAGGSPKMRLYSRLNCEGLS